ncbi:hypothetical protein BJX66DRAFT_293074 [Aspergillus keveii]|uniref:Uncharacterized protein n=1 Tax=Aspergillus keveii TaxID=714993 RepID=A0ABR4GKE6_9EURO
MARTRAEILSSSYSYSAGCFWDPRTRRTSSLCLIPIHLVYLSSCFSRRLISVGDYQVPMLLVPSPRLPSESYCPSS